MKNCVYRFKNISNEIIYIGKAKVLKSRLKGHKHLPQECYSEVSLIEYTIFDTEDDVDLAERYYISKIKPKYNTEFKGKNISIAITDLEEKKWLTYGETFTKNSNVDQIAVLKLEDEIYINTLKVNEIEAKIIAYTSILNKLKDKIGPFTFTFNEEGKQLVFLNENKEKQVSLAREVEQYHLIEESIADERYALNEAQNHLHSLKVSLVKEVLGKEQSLNTDAFTIDLFAFHNVYTEEEVIEIGWDEFKTKYINDCLRQICETGYYYQTNLHKQVADDLEVAPYLMSDGWKRLLYGLKKNNLVIDPKKYSHCYNLMITQIEESIEQQVGKLKMDFVIVDEPKPGMGKDVVFQVAHLVKRTI